MDRLQQVLATNVLEALRAREHVVFAPGSAAALCDEVAAIIGEALGDITPHLDPNHRGASLGHTQADAAVESVVLQITERLLESDHVDDIYADDRLIRRDAFRTIRKLLLGYIRGEIEVEDDNARDSLKVQLHTLGYVVSSVVRCLERDMLCDALERAAASVGGRFVSLSADATVGKFTFAGGAEVGRLALEEAITEELVALVDAELVELPSVEQVLELSPGYASMPGFKDAIARAELRTRSESDCNACCQLVDDHTLIATLIPLSQQAAEHAENLFSAFVASLENELTALVAKPDQAAAAAAGRTSNRNRQRRQHQAEQDADAPKSHQRGKRAPRGRASQTRSKKKAKTIPKRRRAKN